MSQVQLAPPSLAVHYPRMLIFLLYLSLSFLFLLLLQLALMLFRVVSLSFACKVIKPGRIFLRRLISLSTKVSKLNHHLDISSSVRSDLLMWSDLLKTWNGGQFFNLLLFLRLIFSCSLMPLFGVWVVSSMGLGFLLRGFLISQIFIFLF